VRCGAVRTKMNLRLQPMRGTLRSIAKFSALLALGLLGACSQAANGPVEASDYSTVNAQNLLRSTPGWIEQHFGAPRSMGSPASGSDYATKGGISLRIKFEDPLGATDIKITATTSGIIVGQALLPLVYEGEALFNIAVLDSNRGAAEALDTFETNLGSDQELPPDLDAVLAHDPPD
jgi:hypothetical protein